MDLERGPWHSECVHLRVYICARGSVQSLLERGPSWRTWCHPNWVSLCKYVSHDPDCWSIASFFWQLCASNMGQDKRKCDSGEQQRPSGTSPEIEKVQNSDRRTLKQNLQQPWFSGTNGSLLPKQPAQCRGTYPGWWATGVQTTPSGNRNAKHYPNQMSRSPPAVTRHPWSLVQQGGGGLCAVFLPDSPTCACDPHLVGWCSAHWGSPASTFSTSHQHGPPHRSGPQGQDGRRPEDQWGSRGPLSRAGVRTLENLTYGDKGVAVSTDETGRGSASYKSPHAGGFLYMQEIPADLLGGQEDLARLTWPKKYS